MRGGVSKGGQFDGLLFALSLGLSAVGIVLIYSATRGTPFQDFPARQVIWVTCGLVAMALIILPSYHLLLRWEPFLYGLNLLLLTMVLFIGAEGGGSSRWYDLRLFRVQPSEFAKVVLVISLARLLAGVVRSGKRLSPKGLWLSFGYVALPMALVFKQPDLGTSLTFLFLWFVMAWMAGARWWHLGIALVLLGAGAVGAWHSDILHDYQKKRVLILLDPFQEPLGAGYHIIQSEIALASGGWKGMGFLQGAQTQLHFVPHQHTDAIFTALGEEWGYLGCLTILGLYGLLLWRGTQVVLRAPDLEGQLIAAGLTAIFGFHVFVNVGVVTGLLPFTGIPLPFLSYGGSNLLTNMLALGLLQNIRLREEVSFFQAQDRSIAARIEIATPPRVL